MTERYIPEWSDEEYNEQLKWDELASVQRGLEDIKEGWVSYRDDYILEDDDFQESVQQWREGRVGELVAIWPADTPEGKAQAEAVAKGIYEHLAYPTGVPWDKANFKGRYRAQARAALDALREDIND